jgi:hypothetical protein
MEYTGVFYCGKHVLNELSKHLLKKNVDMLIQTNTTNKEHGRQDLNELS